MDAYSKAISKNRFQQRLLSQRTDVINYTKRKVLNQMWFDKNVVRKYLFGINARTPNLAVRPITMPNFKRVCEKDIEGKLCDEKRIDIQKNLINAKHSHNSPFKKYALSAPAQLRNSKISKTTRELASGDFDIPSKQPTSKSMATRRELTPSRLEIAVSKNAVSARSAKRITRTRACLETLEKLTLAGGSRKQRRAIQRECVLPVVSHAIDTMHLQGKTVSRENKSL